MVDLKSGQESYFALLAAEMMKIADEYGKDVHSVHKVFYGVSCDHARMRKYFDLEK